MPGGQAGLGSRPWMAQFTSDTFMADWLAAVGRSGGGWTPEAWEPLNRWRDFSEPPAALVDATGQARYPEDRLVPEVSSEEWESSETSLPKTSDQPAWQRKLYRPFHRHFHIVSAQLVCERPGLPRLGASRHIVASGVVLRRLVPGLTATTDAAETWEDWVQGASGQGAWHVIASGDMHQLQGQRAGELLDPEDIPADAAAFSEALTARLGDALKLLSAPTAPLPPALGQAAEHTARYCLLPLGGGEPEAPVLSDAQVDALATRLELESEAAFQSLFVQRARELRAPLCQSLLALLGALLPPRPTAPAPSYDADRANKIIDALFPLHDDDANRAESWWSQVVSAYIAAHGYPTAHASEASEHLAHQLWMHAGLLLEPSSVVSTAGPKLVAALLARAGLLRVRLYVAFVQEAFPEAPHPDAPLPPSRPAEELSAWMQRPAELPSVFAWNGWTWKDASAAHLALARVERDGREVVAELARAGGSQAVAALDDQRGPTLSALGSLFGIPSGTADIVDKLAAHGLDGNDRLLQAIFDFPGLWPPQSVLTWWADQVGQRYQALSADQKAEAARQAAGGLATRLDRDHLYAAWCWAKIASDDGCSGHRLVWSRRTAPFSVADPMDPLGHRPVPFTLPDVPQLIKALPRLVRARANPSTAVSTPPGSGVSVGDTVDDSVRLDVGACLCLYGMPVHTLIAWILFQIVLSILLLIPGFSWILSMKVCLPLPRRP